MADDHEVFLDGIQAVLAARGIDVVARATNGGDAVRLARAERPDVVVLDVAMPLLSGLDAARDIARALPAAGLILLSGLTQDEVVREAARIGVRGFVVKTQAAEELVQAIHQVWRGGVYVSAGPDHHVVQAYLSGSAGVVALSDREREVLRLLAEGKTAKESAALLGISVRTVDAHRAHIMRRLGIHETAGLVRYAIRQGLVVP